ncbi:MAG: lysophospholipid acyltransferase family protein [Pseudomonadota bacterium]
MLQLPDLASPSPRIDFSYAAPEQTRLTRGIIRSVERVSGQLKLKRLYEANAAALENTGCFFTTAIDLMDLTIRIDHGSLFQPLPKGPTIFIANHPYGVLDGIVFTWLAQQMRPETKVMANAVLCRAPKAAQHLLPVDFAPTREAMKTNLATRKAALDILAEGGSVGLFPAGGVATSQKPFGGPALDPPWSSFLAKLVRKSGASVVPLYFAGQNSRLFQISSHFSYTMRLALYFHETSRLMGKTIRVAVGEPVSAQFLAGLNGNDAVTRHLRHCTFNLAQKLNLPKNRQQNADEHFTYPARFGFQ